MGILSNLFPKSKPDPKPGELDYLAKISAKIDSLNLKLNILNQKMEKLSMSDQVLIDKINTVNQQLAEISLVLTKVQGEVAVATTAQATAIETLTAELATANQLSPEAQEALAALSDTSAKLAASAAALDAINIDAATPETAV